MLLRNLKWHTYQGYLRVADIENYTGMMNKYENTHHIEINIERAVLKYNYKIKTRTPFMFAICTVRSAR